MPANANITLDRIIIGTITVDEPAVRGEGNAHNPHLVVRLKITLHQQPDDGQLILTNMSAGLHVGPSATGTATQLGAPVQINLLPQFLVRTVPNQPVERLIDLRFPLTQAQIVQVEAVRHARQDNHFVATLSLEATAAWVARTWNLPASPLSSIPPDDATRAKHPVRFEMGMHSLLAPFWNTKVENLTVRVPASVWVDQVLPGIGLNTLRLIEIKMPLRGESIPTAALEHFDTAVRQLDLGQYRDSMQSCRDVRSVIERELGATEAHPVGNVVAERLGWGADTPQQALLNAMWRAFRIVTNEAHHLPGGPRLVEADARACQHLTALLLEYIGQLLR